MKFVRFYLIVLILVFLSSCRTPSKTRFKKITGIELSDSITVIEDKFEESGSDYGLTYIILVTKKDCLKLTKKLENYKEWRQNGRNWEFHKTENGITYDIIFSITDCKITYNENLI